MRSPTSSTPGFSALALRPALVLILHLLLAMPAFARHSATHGGTGLAARRLHRAGQPKVLDSRSLNNTVSPSLAAYAQTMPEVAPPTMAKRDGGGARFTFYQTGLGACGGTNKPHDFIVALNAKQWDGGKHCYEMITISYNGKTTKAQIVDEVLALHQLSRLSVRRPRPLVGPLFELRASRLRYNLRRLAFRNTAPRAPRHTQKPKPKPKTKSKPKPKHTLKKEPPRSVILDPPRTTESTSAAEATQTAALYEIDENDMPAIDAMDLSELAAEFIDSETVTTTRDHPVIPTATTTRAVVANVSKHPTAVVPAPPQTQGNVQALDEAIVLLGLFFNSALQPNTDGRQYYEMS
ncbi:hypothetical protein DFH11DRAFT_1724479 [Phellopilus nigrolimitatus]|nr:hypothetical protein DFH11DRAFT_1724479 [Phellopilus nigrolimitatus]